MMRPHRPNWPAALLWGGIIIAGTSSAAGLITWSWQGIGIAAAATLVLFALLMLALSFLGKG